MAALAACPAVLAQTAPLHLVVHPVRVDSGLVGHPGNAAPGPVSAFGRDIKVDGAPWIRVVFDDVTLEGRSYLLVTSLADGEFQVLDSTAVQQWQYTSAFFNGDAVNVQLIAAPGTAANRVTISRVLVGGPEPAPAPQRAVCDSVDSRVPSADPRTARLLFVRIPVPNCPNNLPCVPQAGGVCSGSILSVALADDPNNRVMVSAGHCFDYADSGVCAVAQFEPIPLSGADCSVRHPPVAKQFVINAGRMRSENLGPCTGHDWAAFTCFPNPNTGRTVFQEQGSAFTAAVAPPASGAALSKFGYGVQGPRTNTQNNRGPYCGCTPGGQFAQFNTTQQTAAGTSTAPVGANDMIPHNVHTCAGDSGCPVVNAGGNQCGIHVGGGCNPPLETPPSNCATSLLAPHVVNGIAQVAANAAPVNDACASALPLRHSLAGATILPITVPFSTIGATTAGPLQAGCGPSQSIDRDVWFRYTAAATGTARLSLCSATFDTKVAVYNAACPTVNYTAIACNDDAACPSALRSALTFPTTNGAEYLIRIGGHNNQSGTGTLEIIHTTAPANDLCANLTAIGLGTQEFATYGAATDGPNEAACGGAINNDVWFGFVPGDANGTWPSVPGSYTVTTCSGTNFDTRLAVYRAACPAAANAAIACNDNTGGCGNGTQSSVAFNVAAADLGVLHIVRVGAAAAGVTGSGVITLSFVPGNDNCANATAAAVGSTRFDTRGATTDGPGACPVNQDVWFTFTAPAAGTYQATTCGTDSAFDTRLAVYTGACGALVQVACGDDECGTQSRVLFTAAAAGNVFRLRVGGAAYYQGRGTLVISGPNAAPFNNECAGAMTIVDGANLFDSTGSTPSAGTPSCFAANNNDVWFRYTATGPNPNANLSISMDTCAAATFDTKLVAYGGTCAALGPELGPCNDDAPECAANRSRITFPAAPGASYLVRLAGIAAQTGTGTLTVRPILTDSCNNAAHLLQVQSGTTPFDTTGALTDNTALTACAANINKGIYFVYFATYTGQTRFSTCGSSYDTKIAVWQAAACGALTAANARGCNDDVVACGAPNIHAQVDAATVAGAAYIIQVGGSPAVPDAQQAGPGLLTITPLTGAAPANDDCGTAFTAALGPNSFSTVNATTDGVGDAGCLFFGSNQVFNDVWYVFVPAVAGTYVADTCAGATFDTKLAVYNACPPVPPGAHVPIACNDDASGCGSLSRVSFAAAANTAYWIRVGAFANGTTGTGILTIRPAPVNDACANFLVAYNGAQAFNTTGATTDGPNPVACNAPPVNRTINQDIWFRYTATATTQMRFSLCGSSYDTILAVYNSVACPPINLLACSDDNPAACGVNSLQSEVAVNVTAGVTYTIRVGGFQSGQGAGTLLITPVIAGSDCFSRGPAGAVGACPPRLTRARPVLLGHFAMGGPDGLADATQCRADWNGDGCISPADVADFVASWFYSAQNPGNLDGDFDCNGNIIPADVAAFVSDWFFALGNPAGAGC
jgi:hypothetical protein